MTNEVISIPRHKKYDYTFAKRLEQIMRERQLYPAQVEKLTGIRRQRIHEYLNGTVQPSAYAVKLIATGLDISADYLLGIEKESAF